MSLLLELLQEGAERAYKRKTSQITRYFRCASGPKKGKLASDPNKCGIRPDPKRVRHGRKVARTKGALRVRKSLMTKKQHVSKRITQLNRNLRNHYGRGSQTNEMYDFANRLRNTLMLREFTDIELLDEMMDQTEKLVSSNTLTLDRLKEILVDTGYTDNDDIQSIADIEVLAPGKLNVRVGYGPQGQSTHQMDIKLTRDPRGFWQADL